MIPDTMPASHVVPTTPDHQSYPSEPKYKQLFNVHTHFCKYARDLCHPKRLSQSKNHTTKNLLSFALPYRVVMRIKRDQRGKELKGP